MSLFRGRVLCVVGIGFWNIIISKELGPGSRYELVIGILALS